MANKTFKINVYVAQKQTKDGRKFNTFYTRDNKNEKTVQVKFVKECPQITKSSTLIVEDGQANFGHDKKGYACWWIKSFVKATELEVKSTNLADYYEEA